MAIVVVREVRVTDETASRLADVLGKLGAQAL